jgi:AI-2 transport protein TqsA
LLQSFRAGSRHPRRIQAGASARGMVDNSRQRRRTGSALLERPGTPGMNVRFQSLVYGAALGLIIGWVLYIGKDVFVPIVFSILVFYVIVGLTRLLAKVPLAGRHLPLPVRYTLSIAVIGLLLFVIAYLALASKNSVVALAPQYQKSLLAAIQNVAAFLRLENEPTWTTLRQDLLAQVNIQKVVGSTVASVTSIVVGLLIVILYAALLLVEQRSFAAKVANLSSDPRNVARIRQITTDISARIGSYLGLKTVLSILLGALSWAVMAFVGLEFAVFWAVLIALLNYIPYIGSILGVFFPVVMAIVQFDNSGQIVAVLLPLSVVQFVIGNILDPFVMSNSLNLSPFAILVSLSVWTGLWGIPGAFLAVPITAILTIVLSEFPGSRPIAVLLSRNGQV